ncbi:MAG: PcfJ domain-containing protein [bacterium]
MQTILEGKNFVNKSYLEYFCSILEYTHVQVEYNAFFQEIRSNYFSYSEDTKSEIFNYLDICQALTTKVNGDNLYWKVLAKYFVRLSKKSASADDFNKKLKVVNRNLSVILNDFSYLPVINHFVRNDEELGDLFSKFLMGASIKQLNFVFNTFTVFISSLARDSELLIVFSKEILRDFNSNYSKSKDSVFTDNTKYIVNPKCLALAEMFFERNGKINNIHFYWIIARIFDARISYLSVLINPYLKINSFMRKVIIAFSASGKLNDLDIHFFERIISLLFSLSVRESEYFSKISTFNLIDVIQLYYDNQEYAIRDIFKEIKDITPSDCRSALASECVYSSDGFKYPNDFHKELLSSLFWQYEKPYLLINNFSHQVYNVVEFLIQHHRINHYPDLPLTLSKKETKAFYNWDTLINVPEIHVNTLLYSLFYAKMLKAGVSEWMIKKVINKIYERNEIDFWLSVAPFFVKIQNAANKDDFDQMLDFMNNNQNIDFKGRTWKSVMRLTEEWHAELQNSSQDKISYKWEKQEIIAPMETETGFQIVELNSSEELAKEGNKLRHCIATYDYSCAASYVSVWSLRRKFFGYESKSLITIEVSGRKIIQARGKCNRLPLQYEMDIIYEWADENGLDVEL